MIERDKWTSVTDERTTIKTQAHEQPTTIFNSAQRNGEDDQQFGGRQDSSDATRRDRTAEGGGKTEGLKRNGHTSISAEGDGWPEA